MDSFTSYILRQAYEKVKGKGDRLAKIKSAVNWERFRPIVKAMYTNDTPRGGRPNADEVVIVALSISSHVGGFDLLLLLLSKFSQRLMGTATTLL